MADGHLVAGVVLVRGDRDVGHYRARAGLHRDTHQPEGRWREREDWRPREPSAAAS